MPDATYEQTLSQVKESSPSDRAGLLDYLDTLLDSGRMTEKARDLNRVVDVRDLPKTGEEDRNGNS